MPVGSVQHSRGGSSTGERRNGLIIARYGGEGFKARLCCVTRGSLVRLFSCLSSWFSYSAVYPLGMCPVMKQCGFGAMGNKQWMLFLDAILGMNEECAKVVERDLR